MRYSFDVLEKMCEGATLVTISVCEGKGSYDVRIPDREFRKFIFGEGDVTRRGVRRLLYLRQQRTVRGEL